MNKRVILSGILLTIFLLFTVPGVNIKSNALASGPSQTGNHALAIKVLPQATDEPPIPIPTIVIPTIVINPTPGAGGGGFFGAFGIMAILVVFLVGAVILIALVAMLRRS